MTPKKNPTKTSSGCWNLKLERLEVRDVPAGFASDDSFVVSEDQLLDVSTASGVLANDNVGGTRNLTAELVPGSGPSSGTLDFRSNGSFSYSPEADFNGTVSFDYLAVDENGETAMASVTLDVTAVNDAPVANDIAAETDVDSSVQIVLEASDVDGDAVSFIIESPQNGQLFLGESGDVTYRPNEGFAGTDTFTYMGYDGELESAPATVSIEVGGANDAPVATNDFYSTDPGVPLAVDAPGVLANDVDGDGDALVALFNTEPANGTLEYSSDGSFTYTPNAGFVGRDTFEYTVDDGNGVTSVGTVTVEVRSANVAPTARDGRITLREDFSRTGTLHGVDVDGDTLTYSAVDGPANGTVVVNADGSFTYTPNANFNGTDSFTYLANDGEANSNVATVRIVVRAVNDAPTLGATTFTLPENSPNGTSVGTVGGADVEGDALTYRIVAGNARDAFEIDPVTGAIRVANSTALDFETRATFDLTVRVTDAGGRSGRATITVRLTDANEPIDILPGNAQNRININRREVIGVAILSSAAFDARTVDVNSLRFGRTGLENSLSLDRRGRPRFDVRDVNGDGRPDVVVQFEVDATGFRVGDTRGFLKGRLTNGSALAADDAVTIRA